MGGAHLQCVNNHYAKFEYNVTNTVEVIGYKQFTKCKQPKVDLDVIMSKLNTPKHLMEYYQMCTGNKWCIPQMCEQSLCKV